MHYTLYCGAGFCWWSWVFWLVVNVTVLSRRPFFFSLIRSLRSLLLESPPLVKKEMESSRDELEIRYIKE